MTKLMQVREGCILYFPDSFPYGMRFRGGQGVVVDLDAPLESEWCAGQMHKLEPAPEGAQAAPLDNPVARRLLSQLATAKPAAEPESVKPKAGAKSDAELEVRPARTKAGAA